MEIRHLDHEGEVTTQFEQMPVPAARPLSDFTVEQVGDEFVIFDCETMQYHMLNQAAWQVRMLCDGTTNIEVIAQSLELPVEVVESTVAELGEAGLLIVPAEKWTSSLSRRRAVRLLAAGAVGAFGLPVVKSITVPDAASAATPNQCVGPIVPNQNCSPGGCASPRTCQSVTTGGYCCA